MLDHDCVIAEALAGKRIAITGATGFVGTALVERLLRCVPDCELVLLVRDGKRTTAARAGRSGAAQERRLRPPARSRAAAAPSVRRDDARGGSRRSPATSAPTGSGCRDDDRAVLAVVRHRHPLGGRGVVRLAARLGRRDQPARADAHRRHCCNELGVTPHLVAVSTCYVAGNRRGTRARGAGQRRAVRPRARAGSDEVAAARRLRGDAEAASRAARPARARSAPRPARELGAAGAPALAAKTEQLRERWVRDRLVEAGRARAASVGWPDAYAFTKALGEQALTDSQGRRCRSASCARRSSSRRGPSRGRAGSAASAWPSR